MKIIDFDAKFFEYARKWIAAHPGLTEQQIEDSYNQMMSEWIALPPDWLDGSTPERYFERFSDADELLDGLEGYHAANVNLPEPLYSRIVQLGEPCTERLTTILRDVARDESLRAEALGLLRDIGTRKADAYLEELVASAEEQSEICDMAADILSSRGAETAGRLLNRYEGAPDYAKTLILDIACNFPGDSRIYNYLVYRLKNEPEHRALNASLLGKLGDARAIEPMLEMMRLSDISYYDYIELRDAVEALGGEVADERSFYGDADFEALRNI